MALAVPAVTSTGQPILILKEGTSRSRGRDCARCGKKIIYSEYHKNALYDGCRLVEEE